MKYLVAFLALLCVSSQYCSQANTQSQEREAKKTDLIDRIKTETFKINPDPKKIAALNSELEAKRTLFFNDPNQLEDLEYMLASSTHLALSQIDPEQRIGYLNDRKLLKKTRDAVLDLDSLLPFDFDKERMDLLRKTESDLKSLSGHIHNNDFIKLDDTIQAIKKRIADYKENQEAEDQTFAIGDSDLKEKNKDSTETKPTVITLDNKDKEIQNIKNQMAQQSSVEARWNILIDTICASDAAFVQQLEKDSKIATDLAQGIFKGSASLAKVDYKEVQSYAKARNAYDRALKNSSRKNIQDFWQALDFTGYQISRVGRFIRKITGTLKPQDYSRYLMEARNPGQLVYWLEKGGNQITKADRTVAIETMLSNAIAQNDMQSLKDLKYFAEYTSSGDTLYKKGGGRKTTDKGVVTTPDLFLSQKQTDRLNKALKITSAPETTITNKPADKTRPSSTRQQERDTKEEPKPGSQERRMSIK